MSGRKDMRFGGSRSHGRSPRQVIHMGGRSARRVIHNAAALASGGPLRKIMDSVGSGIRGRGPLMEKTGSLKRPRRAEALEQLFFLFLVSFTSNMSCNSASTYPQYPDLPVPLRAGTGR